MSTTERQRMLHEVELIVDAGAKHLLSSYEKLTHADVEHKGSIDLVTRLDLEAQEIIEEQNLYSIQSLNEWMVANNPIPKQSVCF